LAVVAVTHLHDDHVGGVAALLENFRPPELWTGFAPDYPAWHRLEEKARGLGIRVRVLKQGDEFEFGGVAWQTLAPARGQPWTGKPRNDDSLVLRVRHGRHAFLLTGDIERRVEARMLEDGIPAGAQVLKVAHHGSRLSSLPPLLDHLRPAVAVISAGAGNIYRLPNAEIVRELRARHALILRTDLDGLVTVRSDGRCLTVEPSRLAGPAWTHWDLF
jgi:competence protein ComEC